MISVKRRTRLVRFLGKQAVRKCFGCKKNVPVYSRRPGFHRHSSVFYPLKNRRELDKAQSRSTDVALGFPTDAGMFYIFLSWKGLLEEFPPTLKHGRLEIPLTPSSLQRLAAIPGAQVHKLTEGR